MKKAIVIMLIACTVGVSGLLFAGGAKEVDASQAKGSVTVYCPHEAGPLNAGVKAFEDATGIKVDVVAAGSGELLKRIEAESANPLGDVFWGGGAESAAAYARYFETFVSKYDDLIPIASKAADQKWIGESPVPVVIMYNKNLVGEDEVPAGWMDLLDPKWKGRIAYADPAKSGSAYSLLCTMIQAIGKDDGQGWDFVRKFVANLDGKIQGSSSNAYKLVADGEYALGLTQEKSVQTYVLAGANVGMVYAKEGTSAVPDSIAIIKGAKNLENAKLFVDFMLGEENQRTMSEQFNRRPVRDDVNPPKGLPQMSSIKLVDYDFEWASLKKAEIISQWKNIVVGR